MIGKNFIKLTGIVLLTILFTQCHQYGKDTLLPAVDDDSDRPAWAGGNTDQNDHIKGNDESGTTRGGDYGDLYALYRDLNGVPIMRMMEEVDEEGQGTGVYFYVVQPVDADGNTLELDAEGELVDPTQAIEVDFGRLNIVRSPQSVLDQALAEALKVINAGEGFTLDFCGRLTIWNTVDGVLTVTKTIDSPRESMAMYQEIMNHGFNDQLSVLLGSGIDPIMLAASSFAAGSDKTGTVDIDEVVYIDGFMGCIGTCPIANPNDYDFNHDQNYYFNFGDCECSVEGEQPFQYTRNIYKDRELIFYNYINGEYVEWKRLTVWQAMEDVGGFTDKWEQGDEGFEIQVKGFAMAVDDAVQVLDFVHGNSNVEFVYIAPE